METIDTDVLIVGGGIAGPALAAALAPHGLGVTLLERNPGPIDTARGDHLQPRVVAVLDSWGVLGDIEAAGAERRLGTRWFDASGVQLLEAMVSDLEIPHPYFLYLNHERISETLLAAAARNPNFVMHRPIAGWHLVEQVSASITLGVELGHGDRVAVTARTLVGADGQNSRVRRLFGFAASTERYSRPISVFEAVYVAPPAGNCLTAHLGQRGIVAVVPRTGGFCKVGVASAPAELKQWREPDPSTILTRLGEVAAGLPIADPQPMGLYPPVRVSVPEWVHGNVVLLGDACHAMHPAQSQGMNVSIRCADALARTLVDGGQDFTRALARYAETTKPAIDPILDANHRAGALFDTTDPEQLGRFAALLATWGRDADALRDYALQTAGYPPAG